MKKEVDPYSVDRNKKDEMSHLQYAAVSIQILIRYNGCNEL